jgi:hypothetical protein
MSLPDLVMTHAFACCIASSRHFLFTNYVYLSHAEYIWPKPLMRAPHFPRHPCPMCKHVCFQTKLTSSEARATTSADEIGSLAPFRKEILSPRSSESGRKYSAASKCRVERRHRGTEDIDVSVEHLEKARPRICVRRPVRSNYVFVIRPEQ